MQPEVMGLIVSVVLWPTMMLMVKSWIVRTKRIFLHKTLLLIFMVSVV